MPRWLIPAFILLVLVSLVPFAIMPAAPSWALVALEKDRFREFFR